jgi:hypothetical protein
MSPLRYPYFGTVVGLAWLNYPDSYAVSSIATVRVSHAREVKGGDPTKTYPGPPGWGSGMGLTTPPHKKICSVENLLNLETGQWRAMLKEAEVPPGTVMPEE